MGQIRARAVETEEIEGLGLQRKSLGNSNHPGDAVLKSKLCEEVDDKLDDSFGFRASCRKVAAGCQRRARLYQQTIGRLIVRRINRHVVRQMRRDGTPGKFDVDLKSNLKVTFGGRFDW